MVQSLPVLLPAICFLIAFIALRIRLGSRCWREAFIAAAITLAVATVLATEALSLVHQITFAAIVVFWLGLTVAAGLLLRLSLRNAKPRTKGNGGEPAGLAAHVLHAGIAVYVITIFVIAIVSPPNSWDSLQYHMPKVMHWIQNQSIGFYPTAIPRQNHLAPGAEVAIMHLQILSGSDRFANLVEWFCMLGCLAAVSLIARELGAAAPSQMLAAVFLVTVPMGIMQASSTQTDYIAALGFICFVYYLLRLHKREQHRWPLLLGLSAALGLGVFAKATVYLFAPPFLLWLACHCLKVRRWRAMAEFTAITAVFLAINVGHYARNWDVYGHPLGPRDEPAENSEYILESHAPRAVLSSLAKHAASHLITPWPEVNQAVERRYFLLHQFIAWDINDPRTSFGPAWAAFSVRKTSYHDEWDGNPVHLLLALFCGFFVTAWPSLRRDRLLLLYTASVAPARFSSPRCCSGIHG